MKTASSETTKTAPSEARFLDFPSTPAPALAFARITKELGPWLSIKKMKRAVAYFLIGTIFMPISCFAFNAEEEIDKLVSSPTAKIDIGLAALTLSKEIYPDIDISSYSKTLDGMVEDIRVLTKGSKDPDYRVRVLNTYIHKRKGFIYDKVDADGLEIKNHILSGILDTKAGSCETFPLLYLALAQRLAYPVYPVPAPRHLFLRYVDATYKMQNMETTSGGWIPDDEDIYTLEISTTAIKNGVYMRTMTYREFLGDLISINALYWGRQKQYNKAIRYLEKSLLLNPRNADTWNSLAYVYLDKLNSDPTAPDIEDLMMRGEYCKKKAFTLGVTTLPRFDYQEDQDRRVKEYRSKHGTGDNTGTTSSTPPWETPLKLSY